MAAVLGGRRGSLAGSRSAPGWEDLEERERALGLRERQPILVSPDGRVDPRLSECLRRSAFSAKAQGAQVTYAPLCRLFFTSLWQRGLDWYEASEDDVEDWEDWRRRGRSNPAPVESGTWAKEQAALKLLYVEASLADPESGAAGLTFTGQLGDVMKESAQIALSFLRSHGAELELPVGDLKDRGVHIHSRRVLFRRTGRARASR